MWDLVKSFTEIQQYNISLTLIIRLDHEWSELIEVQLNNFYEIQIVYLKGYCNPLGET